MEAIKINYYAGSQQYRYTDTVYCSLDEARDIAKMQLTQSRTGSTNAIKKKVFWATFHDARTGQEYFDARVKIPA